MEIFVLGAYGTEAITTKVNASNKWHFPEKLDPDPKKLPVL
jgi:hypothetical protein